MQEPKTYSLDIEGDELAVLEWPGSGDPILLLHATGFHSRCWNEVVKRLPGRHVYAVDLRFHGASSDAGEVDWAHMSDDISGLTERLGLKRLVGVGHSIGGHLIARAAARQPERFKSLLLLDPVILPPEVYDQIGDAVRNLRPEDHPVSRRKNSWQDAEEMFQRFRDKDPFDTWDVSVLRDYCDYALRPDSEEGFRQLACDPINEAGIYVKSAHNRDILTKLPNIQCPVTLLRAREGDITGGPASMSTSPTWPGLAAALPDCTEVYLPDMNHFIPMCDPTLVASHILELCIND